MNWFRRALGVGGDEPPAPPAPPAAPPRVTDDSPEGLRESVERLDRKVNRSAGRLPTAAVVNARAVTDVLQEVIRTSGVRPLDVYSVIAVRGIAEDYLPTTLDSFLAVDPAMVEVPRASGHTPSQSLLIQIDTLYASATATLRAAREQDVDALMSQGSFLRTKFTGSDLDL